MRGCRRKERVALEVFGNAIGGGGWQAKGLSRLWSREKKGEHRDKKDHVASVRLKRAQT